MDENDRTYEELFNQLNELISYNRLYVVPKKGSSKSEDEDGGDDSEDGGSSDGGSSDVTPVTPEPTPSGGEEG